MAATTQLQQGTALTWAASGGDYTITMTSVTSTNGRQGVKGDLGANWARTYSVLFTSSVGSAATNGTVIELYAGRSNSATAGTNNPGGLSGTDATFNTTPAEYKLQLDYIGSLVLSNNAGTGIQKQWFTFYPRSRYIIPVIVNSSGQTLGSTAGDHTIVFLPINDYTA